jgi:hypothetical protein
VKVDDQSAISYASLVVSVGLSVSLKMSISLLLSIDGCKVQGEGIIIIDEKNFVNAVYLIDRVSRNGMTALEIVQQCCALQEGRHFPVHIPQQSITSGIQDQC